MESCEYFELLLSRSLDGDLTPQEQAALQLHLDECPQCRELAGQLDFLHQSLAEWEEQPVPEGFARGVMDRICAGESEGAKPLPLWRRPSVRALGSLAACALLCLGLWRMALPSSQAGVPMTIAVGDEPTADLALPESQTDGPASGEPEMTARAYAHYDGLEAGSSQSAVPACAPDSSAPDSDQFLISASGALGTSPGSLFVLTALPDGLELEGTWTTTPEGWAVLQLEEAPPEEEYQELTNDALLLMCQGDGPAAVLLLNE